jgi:hypothetical protein
MCGEHALAIACDDPAAEAPCQAIVDACGSLEAGAPDAGSTDAASSDAGIKRSGTTMASCKSFLNGMNSAGRLKMQSCMVQTCGYYPALDAGIVGGGMAGCLLQLGGALPQ